MGPKLVTTSTATNPNVHDLEIDENTGQPVMIGGDIEDQTDYATMIAQRIKCRIYLWRGEWYLDQRTGTPWEQRLLRKGADEETLRQVLTAVITGTPGVRQLVSLDVDFDPATREATVAFEVLGEMNQIVNATQLDEPFIVQIPEGPNG